MRIAMSSFDIAAVVRELGPSISGMRIDNVYQLDPKTLLFRLRGPGKEPSNLIVEAGVRIHLTSYSLEKPKRPPAFSMALRKYLRNGKVVDVHQYGFERVVVIKVYGKDGDYALVLELFGDGNVILVAPNGEILHALRYRRMRDRNILRGEVFKFPPASGKDPRNITRRCLEELRNYGNMEVVRALTRLLSIGGLNAEEILLRAGVDKRTPCESLSERDLDEMYTKLREVLSEIETGRLRPVVFLDEDGEMVDFAPVPLKVYSHLRRIEYKTFNEALDEYYAKIIIRAKAEDVTEKSGREIGRLERTLQYQKKALKRLKKTAEHNRKLGDIIYRHLNELIALTERIMNEKRRGKEWSEIIKDLEKEKKRMEVPSVYFESLNPKELMLEVSVEGEKIRLDLRKSIQENAARYYEMAKKARRKIGGAEKAIGEVEAKIAELRRQMSERLEEAQKPPRRAVKREWYEKFRWFYSSDGFLVIGGRDASTNEVLLRRYMEPNDVVLHAEIPGAPFVLIKTGGKSVPERTIREAAQLAASYSRAWKEMFTSLDVYWVTPQQVSKSPPSGEYLRRGSFMIYGRKNYIRGVPLEVAVGIKAYGSELKVIGGPPDAIARQAKAYVRLVPGREASGRLAKAVRSKLAEASPSEMRNEVLKIPIEEFQRFIPYGRGALKT